jgi:hypothetical protein
MYSDVVMPSYDMPTGFERVPVCLTAGVAVLGFLDLVSGWDEGCLGTGGLNSAIYPGDESLRALDHESTSFRNWAVIASACRSAPRSASSSWV